MSRDSKRTAGELNARELGRWVWRQLTSMRTALILLLLLALGAIPGSIIPQESVDSLGASQWKESHPKLTPIYERLSLFSVYDSVWFSAIYILLMISLVGCIIPRLFVYARAMRAQPPKTPKHLGRLPHHAEYASAESGEEVLDRARTLLRKKGYRLRKTVDQDGAIDSVSAERGYLREAGNLLFHLSILVVLVGFAMGSLFGYKGGIVIVKGSGFANTLNQYDDFVPGKLFDTDEMEPFYFNVKDFDVSWLVDGPRAGTARSFRADLEYQEEPGAETKNYDLRVNHPLAIGGTQLFLIGHGYAPVITVRDGDGDVTWSAPTIFLPEDASFLSFGVVKAANANPQPIGLEGLFYPTFAMIDGNPTTIMGDDNNPVLSLLAYTGDLGMESGRSQSVYTLDKSNATQVTKADGSPFRLDLAMGQTIDLPDGLGSVTFEGVEPWVRIQISKSPGELIALGGVVLALIGLLGSLFIRPRRVWVRVRAVGAGEPGWDTGDRTLVEVAALDRSTAGDVGEVLDELVAALKKEDAT